MESIKLSFEAVMPIFLLMLLGYIINKTKLADKKSVDIVNDGFLRFFSRFYCFITYIIRKHQMS